MAKDWEEYGKRLDAKKAQLANRQIHWYKVTGGWIQAESRNEIRNLQGPNKWDGWEITGQYFLLVSYLSEAIRLVDGQPEALGMAYKVADSRDRTKANEAFATMRQQLKERLEASLERVFRIRVVLLADERTSRQTIIDDRKVPQSKVAETLAKVQQAHCRDTSRKLTYQVLDVDANELVSSSTENPFWES